MHPVQPSRRQGHARRRRGAGADRPARGADLLAEPSAVGALGAAEPAGAALCAAGASPRDAHRARATTPTVWRSARPTSSRAPATRTCPISKAASRPGRPPASSCSPACNVPSKAFGEFVEHACDTPNIGPEELQPADRATAPTSSCSTAGRSTNTAASRSRPRPTCRAPSWCCACATWRPRPTRWSSSIAPAAPAASSARSR